MFQAVPRSTPVLPPEPPEDRFVLPGFGLPLDFSPLSKDYYGIKHRSLFPTALDDRDIERGYINQPLLALREITMMRLMDEFTDIPDWTSKIHDDSFVENWKKQVRASGLDVSDLMFNFVVDELKFKARIANYYDAINIYSGDVVKSDAKVFQDTAKEFQEAIKPLQKVADYQLGYHTGSEETERDLVHPSLFPLVYGRSRILKDRIIGLDDAIANIGQGDVIPVPDDPGIGRSGMSWNIASRADVQVKPFSAYIQWLPAEVRFRPDGSASITSYINNVHPIKHRDVYRLIERLLNKLIPMWNMSLTPIKDMLHSRSRIEYGRARYQTVEKGVQEKCPQQLKHETQGEFEDRLHNWQKCAYEAIQPEPGRFTISAIPPPLADELPPEERNKHRVESQMDLRKDYGERGLQVIVRIHNTMLRPDKPEYDTPWHVEGQMNEHICAGSNYIFDVENMEEARFEFRQASDVDPLRDVVYEKGDTVWLEQIYGLTNDSPAVQAVGGIACRPGRAITWPNMLQHRVRMRLKDPSKPGHFSALNIMLVDPNIRIISTANVPPQRLDWKDVSASLHQDLADLSVEEQAKLVNREGDFPWTVQEALGFMKEAKEERAIFNFYQNVAFHSKTVAV